MQNPTNDAPTAEPLEGQGASAAPARRSWLAGHPLLFLVVRRLLVAIPLLLVVSFITFTILFFTEGDPVVMMLGDKANDPALVERIRTEQGLNDPFLVQYFRRIKGIVLHFDFGREWIDGESVADKLRETFPATLELTIFALLISTTIGLAVGILSALKRNSLLDYAATSGALLGVSIPAFWLGLLLIYYFAVKLQWFPMSGRLPTGAPRLTMVTGMITVDALLNGMPRVALDGLKHLVLPAVTVGMISAALVTRMTRSSMIEASLQDYVRTARAKGVGPWGVTYHMLRNALVPIVTIIGLQIGGLLSGAIITETIFSLNGIGKYLVESIRNRDGNAVQGAVMLVAFVFIAVNTLVDILYVFLDPRIRAEGMR